MANLADSCNNRSSTRHQTKMKTNKRRIIMKPICLLVTIAMVMVALPHQFVSAAMVETETVLKTACAQKARNYLNRILAREDVRVALRARGIDPLESKLRVDCLSDAEVIGLANQLEQLPAGADMGSWGIFGIAVFVVAMILIITDLLGITDLFNIK
jgi:hypothetical protein